MSIGPSGVFPSYGSALLDLFHDDCLLLPSVPRHRAVGDQLSARLIVEPTPTLKLRMDAVVERVADRGANPVVGDHAAGIEEYIRGRLGMSFSALSVFEEIERCFVPELRTGASDAAEDSFWNDWNGLLLSPRIRRLLRRCQSEGDAVLDVLEGACWYILPTLGMDDAYHGHAAARMNLLSLAANEDISGEVLSVGEFFSDYVLLQRAVWEDLRSVSRIRSPAERTSFLLTTRRRAGQLCFVSAWGHAENPEAIATAWDKPVPRAVEEYVRGVREVHVGTPAFWEESKEYDDRDGGASAEGA